LPQINQFSRPRRKKFYLDRLLNEQVGSEAESPQRGLLLAYVKPACRGCLYAVTYKQARTAGLSAGLDRTEPALIMPYILDGVR
jgi:hypothetical protein